VITADRAIGIERKRSITPSFRSSDRPIAVMLARNVNRLNEDARQQVVDVAHAGRQ